MLVLGIGNSACDIAVESSRVARRDLPRDAPRRAHPAEVPVRRADRPPHRLAAGARTAAAPAARDGARCCGSRRARSPTTGCRSPTTRCCTRTRRSATTCSPGSGTATSRCGRTSTASRARKVFFADGTRGRGRRRRLLHRLQGDASRSSTSGACSADDNHVDLYRRVVDPDHPGLYFIGLVQPLGAIMPLAEAQAEWVADLVTGAGALPSYDEMRRQIAAYDERLRKRYVASKRHTIQVDFHAYLAELRRERRRSRARQRARQPAVGPAAPVRVAASPGPAAAGPGGHVRGGLAVLSRTTSSVGSTTCLARALVPARLASMTRLQLGGRRPALLGDVLADGGELRAQPAGQRAVVEADHREVAGDARGRAPRRPASRRWRSRRRSTARRWAGRAGRAASSAAAYASSSSLLSCRCTTGVMPAGVEHVEVAEQPLAGDVLRRLGRRRPGRRTKPGVPPRAAVITATRRVPEVDEVLGGRPGAAAVVDVDRGDALGGLLVDEDHRQVAPGQPVDRGHVRVAGVDDRRRPSATSRAGITSSTMPRTAG